MLFSPAKYASCSCIQWEAEFAIYISSFGHLLTCSHHWDSAQCTSQHAWATNMQTSWCWARGANWSRMVNHLVALAHHKACLCAMHDASAMCQLNYGAAAISLTDVVQQAMAMSACDAGSSPVDIAMGCCCTLRGSAESIPECTLAASLSARCNSVMRITASSIRAPAWCLKGLRFWCLKSSNFLFKQQHELEIFSADSPAVPVSH